MKLNEIRTFVAVAEAQSVQEAGNRLGLTQSAVSRLIQRLEAELGVILFDRQTKPLALTRDGERALAHARRVLTASDDLSDAFAATARPQGTLRLGVSHVLANLAAYRPLDTLRAAFPDLVPQLHSDWSLPLIEQVRTGALDGALVLMEDGRALPEDLSARLISRETARIVASAEMVGRQRWTLPAMNAVGWVLQPDGCKYREALKRALAGHGLTPNVTVEAFDQTLLLSLVARGAAFGLAPMRLLAPMAMAERVRAVDMPDFSVDVVVWLLRARLSGRIGPVFDRLEDSLRDQLAPDPMEVLHSAAE